MAIAWETKRPDEVRDYEIDWSSFLAEDTISTSTVAVSGVTLDSDNNDDTTVTVWLSGGTDKTIATVTNTIETAGGRTETQAFALLIANADEPVTLTEAKAQCRMSDDDSEDTYIASLIPQARAYVEKVSRYYFVAATRTESFARFGDWLEIYRRPIASIDEIIYGSEETEYTGFVAALNLFPVRIYPASGGEFPDPDVGTITVTYTSGSVDFGSEEYLIGKRAMLLLIGHWFEFREAAMMGTVSDEIAFCIKSMLDELRPISGY